MKGKERENFGEDQEIGFRAAASCPLVLPTKPHSLRLEIERRAEELSIPLNIKVESDSTRLVRCYVASGVAYSILPWSSFCERYLLGLLFAQRIVEPELKRTYLVAWPRGRPMNRPSAMIRDLTLDVLKDVAQAFPSQAID
ncbi:MAG: LysR substrate-binding domain-containing protein [Rhodospirillales bacterium]|nr:LysR substrate-binding domain-containing protein [Rhodospirillales bacterium]MDP6884301.1 LysR substrate-binding domain-containing protein [Rhodospirillales bacterium]